MLSCYKKIPKANWPSFVKKLGLRTEAVFESMREDGWKMTIFTTTNDFGGFSMKLIPPNKT
jgi:hypothetical protein